MDDVRVLPDAHLNTNGPICQIFLDSGLKHYRQVAELVRNWPYGYPEDTVVSVEDCVRLGYGTCVEKHAILAACAAEIGVPVYKAVGIYPLDARLVPAIESLLLRVQVPLVPATHCFLTFQDFRVDLTEGNCNGKSGSIDRYWKIRRTTPLPSHAELDQWYRSFIETELALFLPHLSHLSAPQWQELKRHCTEVLKLSLACQRIILDPIGPARLSLLVHRGQSRIGT